MNFYYIFIYKTEQFQYNLQIKLIETKITVLELWVEETLNMQSSVPTFWDMMLHSVVHWHIYIYMYIYIYQCTSCSSVYGHICINVRPVVCTHAHMY